MHKIAAFLIFSLILCFKPARAQKIVEKYPNGEKKYQGRLRDELKVGTHTYWHENGEKRKEEKYNDLGALVRLREWNDQGELIKDEKPEELLELWRKEQFQKMPWVHEEGIGFYKLKGENLLQKKTNHQQLVVHYSTYLENGKELDDTFRRKIAMPIDLNSELLIEGFLIGLSYFEPGDNGYIKIPAELAYGSAGTQGVPSNATIYFHVIVLKAQ